MCPCPAWATRMRGWGDSRPWTRTWLPSLPCNPQDRTLSAGTRAGLSVGFIGGPPLQFQWRLNGVDLPGQTNATLTFEHRAARRWRRVFLGDQQRLGSRDQRRGHAPPWPSSRTFFGAGAPEAPSTTKPPRLHSTLQETCMPPAISPAPRISAAQPSSARAGRTSSWPSTTVRAPSNGSRRQAAPATTAPAAWPWTAPGPGVLVTGYFSGSANFGVTNFTSAGGLDIFLAQLDRFGNWVWASQAGGSHPRRGARRGGGRRRQRLHHRFLPRVGTL